MNKRIMGSLLFLFGLIIVIISLWGYVDARGAQREMLLAHAVSEIPDEIPVVQQETLSKSEAELSYIKQADSKKVVPVRKDYQNGQMTIEISKLKVNAAVVKGTSTDLLKKGPGLYESSPLPGEAKGNVCIAGHRTTYGAWFRNVDKLKKGDEIVLHYNGNKYIYLVQSVFIVDKKDWSIIKPLDYSAITLTSCHPLRSSKQRIVVRGMLVE